VKCKLDISPMSRTLVEGEPTQLRQVIMNLVTNASEALGDRPGRVSVSGGLMTADAAYLAAIPGSGDLRPGEYVYLEVSDSGDGISPKLQRRIFEPFFSTKFTGRGLGLATVLGIVRGHGGAIRLESEPGRGTCFRVLLPPAARVAPPPDREEEVPPTQLSGRQILVVDDEEAVLELAGEFLLRGGLDPITAGGGLEALEILRRDTDEAIDAVVLDLSMPELDGHETLLEIRRLRAALPVIITSGYGVASSSERFTSDDAVSFLRKPFDPEDLIDALRAALA
jgi:CheY-like chemotaxis protein